MRNDLSRTTVEYSTRNFTTPDGHSIRGLNSIAEPGPRTLRMPITDAPLAPSATNSISVSLFQHRALHPAGGVPAPVCEMNWYVFLCASFGSTVSPDRTTNGVSARKSDVSRDRSSPAGGVGTGVGVVFVFGWTFGGLFFCGAFGAGSGGCCNTGGFGFGSGVAGFASAVVSGVLSSPLNASTAPS